MIDRFWNDRRKRDWVSNLIKDFKGKEKKRISVHFLRQIVPQTPTGTGPFSLQKQQKLSCLNNYKLIFTYDFSKPWRSWENNFKDQCKENRCITKTFPIFISKCIKHVSTVKFTDHIKKQSSQKCRLHK